jgi:hypothetical protein
MMPSAYYNRNKDRRKNDHTSTCNHIGGESMGAGRIAGKSFPWEYVTGAVLRVSRFVDFTTLDGIARAVAMQGGAYGLLLAEVPDPDRTPDERLISVPIEHRSDCKSLSRAQMDFGVLAGETELVAVYENRRGWFGRKKASLHIAAFSTGTWNKFLDAVACEKAQEFSWPNALFLFQPGRVQLFQAQTNLFSD